MDEYLRTRMMPVEAVAPIEITVVPRRCVTQTAHGCEVIRIAIIDATRLGSESLAGMLRRSHCEVVLAGTSAQEAMEVCAHVDVVLISSTLEGEDDKGFQLSLRARKTYPHLRVVMIVDTPDPQTVVRAFQAGARGIFGRDSSPHLISKCVARIHEGQVWASTEQLQYVIEALTAPPRLRLLNNSGLKMLAPREEEVVHWVTEGLMNREIAEKLNLSENTVKNYLFRVFEKLGISSRVELILYAASQFAHHHSAPPQISSSPQESNNPLRIEVAQKAIDSLAVPYCLMADAYRYGRGVQQQTTSALMWYVITEQVVKEAAASAASAREQLERELPRREILIAKRRAAEVLRKRRAKSDAIGTDRV